MADQLIRMKVQTVYGVGRFPGDEFMVPDYVARLWDRRGIAEIITPPVPEPIVEPEPVEEAPIADPVPLEDLIPPAAIEDAGGEQITEDATYFSDSTAPALKVAKPKRQSKRVPKEKREG